MTREKKNNKKTITLRQYKRNKLLKQKLYSVVRRGLYFFILASIVNFVFSYFFHTPKVFSLNNDNLELISKIEHLQNKIALLDKSVSDISYRDNNIYRVILEVDSVDKPIIGDIPINTTSFSDNRNFALIEQTWQSVNDLSYRLLQQSITFDTLQYLSLNIGKMVESLPAIWPIDKNNLRGEIGKFSLARYHPVLNYVRSHDGIDLAGTKGDPIYATANGKVIEVRLNSGYGKNIVIDHGYGYKTRYAHLSKFLVEQGDTVVRGMQIAELGSTGVSTGPHLHYEVIHNGVHVNPLSFLGKEMKDEDFYNIINSAKETIYEPLEN
ncbi:MAG: M23 family metallopeptidase [Rikenellaceae bacterium]